MLCSLHESSQMKFRVWMIPLAMILFPILEIIGLLRLIDYIGAWTIVYLLMTLFAGGALIAGERVAALPRLLASLHGGASPLYALFQSGRYILAGMLLIIPGVFSDVLALALLLWPKRRIVHTRAANDDIIEGKFTREATSPQERLPKD